jgi:beta-glucosidase-like glycosyl hydrolase
VSVEGGGATASGMGRRFIVAAPVERSLAALYTRTEDYLDRGLGGIVVGVGGRHPLLDRPDGTLDVDAAFRYVEFVRDADPRVAIAVDAEGGSIFNVLEGISPLASPRTYAETSEGRERLRSDAAAHARILADLGVTMNFAPLLDVALPGYRGYPADDQRAWSDDPAVVIDRATVFCEAMMSHGIVPVGKHFPGYGSLEANPHRTFTRLPCEYETVGLSPYHSLTGRGMLSAIMTGHAGSSVDPDTPGSLSPRVARVLRDEIGFDGVMIADELFMGAITEHLERSGRGPDGAGEERAVAALAVNDMVIVSYPVQRVNGTIEGVDGGGERFPTMVTAATAALHRGDLAESHHTAALERIETVLAGVQ